MKDNQFRLATTTGYQRLFLQKTRAKHIKQMELSKDQRLTLLNKSEKLFVSSTTICTYKKYSFIYQANRILRGKFAKVFHSITFYPHVQAVAFELATITPDSRLKLAVMTKH